MHTTIRPSIKNLCDLSNAVVEKTRDGLRLKDCACGVSTTVRADAHISIIQFTALANALRAGHKER